MSSPAAQLNFTPEVALAYRDITLARLEEEHPTTARVIGRVPDAKREYKPEPNSRSAWDLACHLAQSDVWFLNAIADGSFEWAGDPPKPATSTAGLVEWYRTEFARAAGRVRAMTRSDRFRKKPRNRDVENIRDLRPHRLRPRA